MPRYFFDLNDGAEWPDDEGVVLPNLETARLEALRLYGAILRDDPQGFQGVDAWHIDIRTKSEGVLGRISLMASHRDVSFEPSQQARVSTP